MTTLEKKEKILELRAKIEEAINSNQKEERKLSDAETSYIKDIRSQIDSLEEEVKEEEEELRKLKDNNNIKENKKMKEIRLLDLIREVANNNVAEEHRNFVKGNTIDYRAAIQADTIGQGAENVPVDKQPLETAIRNASVLTDIGATWFSNAVGDVKCVKYEGSNTYWTNSENAQAQDGASGFTEITLTPKRLSSYLVISRQFLDQSPEDAEAILINDLARAISEKIDMTVFGAAAGTNAQPAGLFADTGYTTTGATDLTGITFENVLGLEQKVEEKNGTNFIFVTDPAVKYALRGTQMASGLEMVWRNGEIDGRKAVVSNSVNNKSLLCFDPRDLACASWGNGLYITVDPYTLADRNQIKVVVNYLFDAKLKGDRIAAEVYN